METEILHLEIIERLYRSEINFEMESYYDAGYYFRLGDYQSGTDRTYNRENFKSVVKKLAELAVEKYPDSEFAKWWSEQNGN